MNASGGNGKDEELPAGQEDASPEPEPAGASATAEEHGLEEALPTREQLEELRRERDQLKDEILRRRAEFENYKKRAVREQQAVASDAAASVLRRLVDTVDNLERALAATGGEPALRHGVELTLRDLLSALESLGVSVLDPLGQRFDPLQQQALLHEHVPGVEEGTVAEVFRKGYAYKDRLLRPALVKVASGEAADDGSGAGGPVDGGDAGEVQ